MGPIRKSKNFAAKARCTGQDTTTYPPSDTLSKVRSDPFVARIPAGRARR